MTLGDGIEPVVILNPWDAHPVFHRRLSSFQAEEPVDTLNLRARLDVPAGFRLVWVRTACGTLLSAQWWYEPRDWSRPSTFEGEYDHPNSKVELRKDHASTFARPCRRCYPTPRT